MAACLEHACRIMKGSVLNSREIHHQHAHIVQLSAVNRIVHNDVQVVCRASEDEERSLLKDSPWRHYFISASFKPSNLRLRSIPTFS